MKEPPLLGHAYAAFSSSRCWRSLSSRRLWNGRVGFDIVPES